MLSGASSRISLRVFSTMEISSPGRPTIRSILILSNPCSLARRKACLVSWTVWPSADDIQSLLVHGLGIHRDPGHGIIPDHRKFFRRNAVRTPRLHCKLRKSVKTEGVLQRVTKGVSAAPAPVWLEFRRRYRWYQERGPLLSSSGKPPEFPLQGSPDTDPHGLANCFSG